MNGALSTVSKFRCPDPDTSEADCAVVEFSKRIDRSIAEGDQAAARDDIAKMLEAFPEMAIARCVAASGWIALQDYREALVQCGIGLALDPTTTALYQDIASVLLLQGHEDLARKVLDNGWKIIEDALGKHEIWKNEFYDSDKQEYYSILQSHKPESPSPCKQNAGN
jgi:hypothetical protein